MAVQIGISYNLPNFKYLSSENFKRNLEYRAVLSGARSLQESIRQSLISNVPKATAKNPKYNDTLAEAVLITKANLTNAGRVVHALGTREKRSGTYRARFFERTTQPRYVKYRHGVKLKKKRYTGKLNGTFFFSKGVAQGKTQAQDQMAQFIQKIINDEIKKHG